VESNRQTPKGLEIKLVGQRHVERLHGGGDKNMLRDKMGFRTLASGRQSRGSVKTICSSSKKQLPGKLCIKGGGARRTDYAMKATIQDIAAGFGQS